MRRLAVLCLAIGLFTFGGGKAFAAGDVLDQSATSSVGCWGTVGTIPPLSGHFFKQAQTFTVGITGLVDRLTLNLFTENPQGNLVIGIYNVDADGLPTGPALGTGTLSPSQIPGNSFGASSWVDVAISPMVPVTAGTQYAIVAADSLASDLGGFGWMLQCPGQYPGGVAIAGQNNGATWYIGQPSADFDFETWVTNPAIAVQSISNTLAGAGLGLAGAAGGNSYAGQLAQVQADLTSGNQPQALIDLQSFTCHLQAQTGKQVPQGVATTLLAEANLLYTLLSGTTAPPC